MRHRVHPRSSAIRPDVDDTDGERPPRDIATERFAGTAEATTETAGAVVLDARIEAERRRGRGAVANPSGRYETESRVAFDDGWGTLEELPPFATRVTIEKPKTIVTRNSSPDIGFDRSINPYRGCEHGCSYCFARPTHAYMGLSPGLDFETNLFVKPDAARLLERELGAASYVCRPIAIGTNTDPYQPIERRFRLMREILEVLERCGHPVTVVTKSALVLRDVDILGRMGEKGLAKVALSVTSLDRRLSRSMEPRASAPDKRLAAIRGLAAAGVPVGVMVAPVIPALNDAELERILEAAAEAGAREAGYILLRLPLEVSEIFKQWLLEHHPDRYRHVLSLLRSMRDGKDYDAVWGRRMRGSGPYAVAMRKRFETATRRLGLEKGASRSELRTDLFAPPLGDGRQLSLF
jgi:DNA repair photolyase